MYVLRITKGFDCDDRDICFRSDELDLLRDVFCSFEKEGFTCKVFKFVSDQELFSLSKGE